MRNIAVMLVAAICIVLLVNPVNAARKELNLSVGESAAFKGKNITLLAANVDSFLLCMNGKRFVVANDRNFQGVVFDVRQKAADYARFGIVVPENGGECEGCDNRACFQQVRVSCFTDVECEDKDACTLDSCTEGVCKQQVNASCGVGSEVLDSGLFPPISPSLPGSAPVGVEVVGNAVVEKDGNQPYRAATFLLLGFLAVLIVIAGLIVKRKGYESWKKKQKYY